MSTVILGTVGYFVRDWKHLHLVCTLPFIPVLLAFKIIPESVRYQRLKGDHKQLMATFRTIAEWNGRTLPDDVCVEPLTDADVVAKSNPSELFRTRELVIRTLVQIFAFFASGMLYYGVYLAASDLGGEKYRDFIVLSVTELPVVFLTIYLCERCGRKKPCTLPLLLSCAAFLALSFTPARSTVLKMLRVVFGIFGKCLMGMNMDVLHTWATELYPTRLRGEALGVFQAALRVGAASAPWLDKELSKLSGAACFLFMGGIALVSFFLLLLLPETKGGGMDECGEEILEASSSGDVKDTELESYEKGGTVERVDNVWSYTNEGGDV